MDDARHNALRMAVELAREDDTVENTIARAEAYYEFLSRSTDNTQSA